MNNDQMAKLSLLIDDYLADHKMTQGDFEKKIGMLPKRLSLFVNMQLSKYPADEHYRIAYGLDMTPDELARALDLPIRLPPPRQC